MRGWMGVALMALTAGMTAAAGAQSGTVGGTVSIGTGYSGPAPHVHVIDRQASEQLAAQGKAVLAMAEKSPQGIGSVTLARYPGMYTMMTARSRSGGAELHANWEDVFVVIDGEASEVTGGTMVDRKEGADGEARGTRVQGGTPTPMRKGDVIHVSAGVPHQTMLEPGKTFIYYVIKVAVPKS